MVVHSARHSGILYVVATPIGNLEDISNRAIRTLESVDVILAEDTRHSRQLLNALGIKKQLMSLHQHNEAEKSLEIIEALQNGQSFALISDAGTPLISDPGFVLIREARRMQIDIVPIPGPCAFVTALSVAGIPCDSFFFEGFLPAKKQKRANALHSIKEQSHTTIIYESSHRLADCLQDIIEVFGEEYQFVLAKELTKSFERILYASGAEILAWLAQDQAHSKGEFVVILPARVTVEEDTSKEDERILRVLLGELPLKQAVKIACSLSGTTKNDLYALALTLQQVPR